MRKIQSITKGNAEVKVYRDTEWNEYICKMYIDGKHLLESDYHTDDKDDALDTAKLLIAAKDWLVVTC